MSYMSRLAWVFLGLWFLGLAPALAQEKPPEKPSTSKLADSRVLLLERFLKPWIGKLGDGRVITKEDLDKILQKHNLWVESDKKEGNRAELSGAKPERANLIGVNLSGADLSGAILSMAYIIGANLSHANLSRAELIWADLSGANLSEAILSGAILKMATLSGADLTLADLSGADLILANLSGARFEPKPGSLPGVTALLYLNGLDSLTFYGTNSYGLMELREIFKKAGMRDQERQVTYALNHTRRVNAWEEINRKAEETAKAKKE